MYIYLYTCIYIHIYIYNYLSRSFEGFTYVTFMFTSSPGWIQWSGNMAKTSIEASEKWSSNIIPQHCLRSPARTYACSMCIYIYIIHRHRLHICLVHFMSTSSLTTNFPHGWWLGHPSEKYKSQLGWPFPTEWNNKVIFQPPATSIIWGNYRDIIG